MTISRPTAPGRLRLDGEARLQVRIEAVTIDPSWSWDLLAPVPPCGRRLPAQEVLARRCMIRARVERVFATSGVLAEPPAQGRMIEMRAHCFPSERPEWARGDYPVRGGWQMTQLRAGRVLTVDTDVLRSTYVIANPSPDV